MYVFLAWFATGGPALDIGPLARERAAAALDGLAPPEYQRYTSGGPDWGITILYRPIEDNWAWSTVADATDLRVVSLGLPIGVDADGGPVALAKRLLRGEDIHTDAVPPFALLVLESDRRFILQQDWLGMCRIFSASDEELTVFSSRPSLAARAIGRTPTPDHDGWTAYAITGHFGGDLSPIQHVRQVPPGVRVTGARHDHGGWEFRTESRASVDDLVSGGVGSRGSSPKEALDRAAQALARTAESVQKLYKNDIVLGLSGGKDSRLIAASLVAAGSSPRFLTNNDVLSEGEIAKRLVEILQQKRGTRLEHILRRVAKPDVVTTTGLQERVRRLQHLYDYQFPSTYVSRPAVPEQLPTTPVRATFSGAGGELATGYWYPANRNSHTAGRAQVESAVFSKLLHLSSFANAEPLDREKRRVRSILDRGEKIGLAGLELVDYVYLVERMRRWCTSPYVAGTITPFLAPDFVSASFSISPIEKVRQTFHVELIRRLVPEWSEIPFVSGAPTNRAISELWDEDALRSVHGLLHTAQGSLPRILRREAVEAILKDAVRGSYGSHSAKVLQQFTYLAVASESLENGAANVPVGSFEDFRRKAMNQAPGRHVMGRAAKPLAWIARRARFLKRTRVGSTAWAAVRRWLPEIRNIA